jgi:hypothetical protein
MTEEKKLNRCRYFLLVGFLLINLAIFAPDIGGHQAGGVFELAINSTWGNWFNLPAAWGSFKIILLCLGLFLVIECLGTFFTVAKRKPLAWLVYSLHIVPSLGFLLGCYYLLKALL